MLQKIKNFLKKEVVGFEPRVMQKTGGDNPSQKVWDDNIQHTLWKFQSFLKDALPSHLRLEWEHATGVMEGAKKKFDQLQREVFIRPKQEGRIKLFIKKVRASFSA